MQGNTRSADAPECVIRRSDDKKHTLAASSSCLCIKSDILSLQANLGCNDKNDNNHNAFQLIMS